MLDMKGRLMAAQGRYHVIEADTLDARKRYRSFIEQQLKGGNFTAQERADLEYELKHAKEKESVAQHALDEEDEEEDRAKSKGDAGDGGEKSGGSASSGGTSGDGGVPLDDEKNENEEMADFESLALLLYMMEEDVGQSYETTPIADAGSAATALAAATLLFNKTDKIAQINEPYSLDDDKLERPPSEFLSSLESHAAKIGANIMQLKVSSDAVDTFARKFGYKSYGKLTLQSGQKIQRMRKSLVSGPLLTKDDFC